MCVYTYTFGVDIIKVHIRDKEYTRSHQFMYITHDNQIPFPKKKRSSRFQFLIPLYISKLKFFHRMYRTLLNVVLYTIFMDLFIQFFFCHERRQVIEKDVLGGT